jgi:TonB family protein
MRNSVLATVLFAVIVHDSPVRAQDLIYASPQAAYSPAPNYPEAAKTAGIQGIVAVQVQIDASGAVTEARVLNGPPELQASALQTAKIWKFIPTMIAGKATPIVSTVNLRFGTPAAASSPSSSANSTPSPTVPRPRDVVAATDVNKIIGTLKWEIREEASGNILASGDGPVHSKDVEIDEAPTANGRITPKTIRLTDEFTMRMAEIPVANVSDKKAFGMSGGRTDIPTFSFEAFMLQDSRHAVKKPEGEQVGIDLKQVNGEWEITRTEFLTDAYLGITRLNVDPPGSAPYWRIHIFKGSNIIWPSIAGGKVIPN